MGVMTLKSSKGCHIVTVNGKPIVFATLTEALKHIFEVRQNETT